MVDRIGFDGRVAIVTGAGRGLGRCFAMLLAERGCAVVVNDIERAAEVSDEIVAAGGRATSNAESVALSGNASNIVSQAIREFGRIDIVINNAGVLTLKPFEELSDEDFARTIDTHIGGCWHLTKAAWGHMKQQKYGRVLMVSSANGNLFPTADHSAYGTAKAGMVGLAKELALEGQPFGIQVNVLMPGAATTMLRSNPTSSQLRIDNRPELVAPPACWLVHTACTATGQAYASSSGRVGRVFTAAAAGYQAVPDRLTLEAVREHWALIESVETFIEPVSVEAYNKFRTDLYEGVV
jgi:NAD(P)-dependent dehydrogenase (short-subunit alcohol dehydrogenase family)